MPWANDRESRRRSDATYGTEWRKARDKALARAQRRCAKCGSTKDVQVDHVIPVSQGGTHTQANLQVLCIEHHRAKTAIEGSGYRHPNDPPAQPRTAW
jgi:5-methylcytosine-specific restriction enzyme A